MRKVIGLTGGVASGKSTVSRFLKKQGANIINVDKIGHKLLAKDEVINLISNSFDGVVLNNTVSRAKLGEIVFNNKNSLEELNAIMYPRMKEEIKSQLIDGINIVDMAILYESGFDSVCDEVVVVASTVETQIARMESRGYKDSKIKGILNSQMDPAEKAKRATYIIENDGTIEHLRKKVFNLFKHLLEK